MIRFLFTAITVLACTVLVRAQYPLDNKRDWQWRFGYDDGAPDWGLSKVDFSSGVPVSTYDTVPFWFDFANASISDTAGDLLFYSNGARVANQHEQETPNGDSIGCCTILFEQEADIGCAVIQGALILPYPNSIDKYVLLKKPIEYGSWMGLFFNPFFQYNILSASAAGGNGDVILKNAVLINDTLSNCGIQACRHANGRDWWLLQREWGKASFYTILLDPNGFHIVDTIQFELFMPELHGPSFFTNDGLRFMVTATNDVAQDSAYIYSFDFDRCSGELSNPQRIQFSSSNSLSMAGASSPNSRFVYVSFSSEVYQFDLDASDLLSSKTLVATYDGFMDSTGSFPKPTTFQWMQLGPDGKLYITAGNTSYLHIVENPDEPGIACNVNQHGFHLSALNLYSMPNFPNFRLGPVDGSPCDTLGIDVINAVNELPSTTSFVLYPNPATDYVQLTWNGYTGIGGIQLCDVVGRRVYHKSVDLNLTMTVLDTRDFGQGVYIVQMISQDGNVLRTYKLVLVK